MNDFMGLEEPIAKVDCTIGAKKKAYDDGKHVYYVNAGVNDESEVARLMDFFKTADPNDLGHGELSNRVHVLKCEKEGEDPMCAITQSFVDEGKIIGVVEYLREDEKMPDEKIVEKIKERFQLNDYQARTFVYPKKEETA